MIDSREYDTVESSPAIDFLVQEAGALATRAASERAQREEPDNDLESLHLYFNEIRRIPLLSHEEEFGLAVRVAAGDREARDKLIEANLRYVVTIAKRYTNQGLELADLIQEGNKGLIHATEKYDPYRGRFTTYATRWITRDVKRAIYDRGQAIHIPEYFIVEQRRMDRIRSQLEADLGRDPTNKEVAKEMGISMQSLEDLLDHMYQMVSMSAPLSSDEDADRTVEEVLAQEEDASVQEQVERAYEVRSAKERAERLLAAAVPDEKDREVVRLIYGFGGNPPLERSEVGLRMGVTRERVRQRLSKAMSQLAEAARLIA